MDNLQTPQSQETKDYLEKECGLVPYAPVRAPNYADPDHASCKSAPPAKTRHRPHDKCSDFRSLGRWTLVRPEAGRDKSTLHPLHGNGASVLLPIDQSQREEVPIRLQCQKNPGIELRILPSHQTRMEQSSQHPQRRQQPVTKPKPHLFNTCTKF